MNNKERSIRNIFRQRLGIDVEYVVVGDASGNVVDSKIPGNVLVRFVTSNGLMVPGSVVGPRNRIKLLPGDPVEVIWKRGKFRIEGIDVEGEASRGNNPVVISNNGVTQQDIATLTVTQTLPTANQSVNVKAWAAIIAGTVYLFPGSSIDLSSLVPSAGNMRYVVVFVKSDYATLEAKGSTARSMVDVPLDITDIQEAITARTAGSTPVWAIALKDNQSTITQDDITRGVDLRNFVNTSELSVSGGVSGPGSSTDRAIVTWNSTTGNTLRDNANATIDSSGNLTVNGYKMPSAQAATLASDAFTTSKSYAILTSESGTSDNLATINGGSGNVLLIIQPASGHTITVKHGTGNIFLNSAADYALSGDKTLLLFYDGTNWADAGIPGSSSSPWQTDSNVVNLVTDGDTVTIGSATAGGKLFIDGDADEVQLQVQANGTQTALLAVFEDSAGNDQVTISGDGAVVINEEGNDADVRIESNNDANNFFSDGGNDNIGMGTGTPNASAKLDIVSTTQGLLPPRLTTAQRDAISSPADGLVIYNSTINKHELRQNGIWVEVSNVTRENICINSEFAFWQRLSLTPTTLTAYADDTYGPDQWYILTQTASIQYQRTTGDTRSTYAGRFKQNQAGAQRMGAAQIIEGIVAQGMRGKSMRVQARVNCSNTQDIRIAILEWTGTMDSVTSDVVNDWTSSTYTAGNFFLGASLTVVGTAEVSATAGTWVDLALTGSISTSCNNLIIFIWTEDTAAQNVTLDITEVWFGEGPDAQVWIPIDPAVDLYRCERFLKVFVSPNTLRGRAGAGWAFTTTNVVTDIYGLHMRVLPSIVATAGDWDVYDGVTATAVTSIAAGVASNQNVFIVVWTVAAGLTQYRPYSATGDTGADRYFILTAEL